MEAFLRDLVADLVVGLIFWPWDLISGNTVDDGMGPGSALGFLRCWCVCLIVRNEMPFSPSVTKLMGSRREGLRGL